MLTVIVAYILYVFFFFQAEDGIRDYKVTGVQTCALPIFVHARRIDVRRRADVHVPRVHLAGDLAEDVVEVRAVGDEQIGRASCRERGEMLGGEVALEKKNG